MNRFIYRTTRHFEKGKDIECKDKDSKHDIEYHVAQGSKGGVKTKYLSCTENIGVAISYSFGYSKNTSNVKRKSIILIDSSKMNDEEKSRVYDLNDKEVLDKYITIKQTKDYARASREVIVDTSIPSKACVEIPPLFVDILFALETEENNFNYGVARKDNMSNESYGIIKNLLLEMIADKDPSLTNILNELNLEEPEKLFINEYYNKGTSLYEICKENFEGNVMSGKCLRTSVIKKIINSSSFAKILTPKAMSEFSGKNGQKYDMKSFQEIGGFLNVQNTNRNKIKYADNYLDSFEELVPRMSMESERYKSLKNGDGGIIVGGCIPVVIGPDESKHFPYGIVNVKKTVDGKYKFDNITTVMSRKRADKAEWASNYDGSKRTYGNTNKTIDR
ncbi:MAG: hypothetical protein N2749_06905 [Clostridia bacterium]|nr:hypothetical protein [Clostridia bacterium]